jgi:hypothetical protein
MSLAMMKLLETKSSAKDLYSWSDNTLGALFTGAPFRRCAPASASNNTQM